MAAPTLPPGKALKNRLLRKSYSSFHLSTAFSLPATLLPSLNLRVIAGMICCQYLRSL